MSVSGEFNASAFGGGNEAINFGCSGRVGGGSCGGSVRSAAYRPRNDDYVDFHLHIDDEFDVNDHDAE